MKKLFLSLAVIGLVIILFSCKKETTEPELKKPTSTKDLQVPSDFTWTTSRTVSVNLQFMHNSQPVSNAPFLLYAGSQANGKLVYDGTSNSNGQFKSVIKVADIYKTIEVVCGNDIKTINIADTTIYHPRHQSTSEKAGKANGIINLTNTKFTKSKAENHIYYPAQNVFGSIAFEDNWPSYGDFDFNDLVMDYNVDVITNNNGDVTKIIYNFIPRAVGAGFHNGFGIQYDWGLDYTDIQSVTGYVNTKFQLDSKGLEPGQTYGPSIIVIDDAWKRAYQSNTDPSLPYIENQLITITVTLASPKNIWYFGFPLSNPFMIVNGDRAREIHPPYYWPTTKASYVYAMNNDDNTPYSYFEDAPNYKMVAIDPSYKSKSGLPWAVSFEEKFVYPIEKNDIINAHLKFADWATTWDPWDWYTNKPGYRDNSKLYLNGGINK